MSKRIIQVVFILAALGAVVYFYLQLSSGSSAQGQAADVIPSNMAFVLEISQADIPENYSAWLQSMSENENTLAGVSFNPISEWPAVYDKMHQLAAADLRWNNALNTGSVIFATNEQGRGDAWIASIDLSEGLSQSDIRAMLNALDPIRGERDFHSKTIYSGDRFNSCAVKNCIVISPSPSLIEDVLIRNEKGQILFVEPSFVTARECMSKDLPLHLLMSMEHGDWLQLDPVHSEGHIQLSGYAVLSDSSRHSFALTADAGELHAQEVLPASTVIADFYSYENFETGWRSHEDYFDGSDVYAFWSRAWSDFGDTCQCDLNEALLSWRSGESGSAVIALNDSATAEIGFYGIQDSADVIQMLRPLLVEQGPSPTGIYKVKYPGVFERNQQQQVLIEANYITQYKNYVFVASTPGDLFPVLQQTSSIAADPEFAKSISLRPENASRFLFQKDFYTSPLPRTLLQMLHGTAYLGSSVERFRDNKFLVNITLPFEGEVKMANSSQENPAEEITASGAISRGPWKVKNHNTGEMEEIAQMNTGDLVLTGTDGNILWKKKISGEILGKLTQIDALKNNKLQYAFTTENMIYVVDRNGNDLPGFPIGLKPPITSGLLVADYDANKKYRLLFAAGDGLIFNYGVNAAPTEGWKHQNSNMVTTALEHFKTGSDDHILVVSITGSMQILKRTGEVRYSPKRILENYNGQSVSIRPGNSPAKTNITYTTKNGEEKTVEIGE